MSREFPSVGIQCLNGTVCYNFDEAYKNEKLGLCRHCGLPVETQQIRDEAMSRIAQAVFARSSFLQQLDLTRLTITHPDFDPQDLTEILQTAQQRR